MTTPRAGCRGALQRAVVVTVLLAHALPAAGGTEKVSLRPVARFHDVQRGDNLTRIALRYGVTVPALVAANRLSGDDAIIRIGQRLVIPSLHASRPRPTPPRHVRHRAPPNLVLAVPEFGNRPPLFAWPADGHVTSAFGRRQRGWHQGVDIGAEPRRPIVASAGGVVVASTFEPLYGRVVRIEHVNGFLTVYAHNDRNLVSVGERVFPGQTIALIGRTGRATAHHLHFEIRQRGLAYNPLYFLPLPPRGAVVNGAHGPDEEPR